MEASVRCQFRLGELARMMVWGKALARAFRWKRLLESGEFVTIAELAEREGIAPTYMTRVLRLTVLAPNIIEAVLDGKTVPEVTLARLLSSYPAQWEEQPAGSGLLSASKKHSCGLALGTRE